MDVDQDGKINGSSFVNYLGYAKPPKLETLQKNKSDYAKRYFNNELGTIQVSDLKVKNEETDSLGLENSFSFKSQLVQNDAYYLLDYNIFPILKNNPFTDEKRNADIDFSYQRHYVINTYFDIATTFDFEELPKNIKMIMPDTGIIFERRIYRENNVLTINFSYRILKPFYTASEYEDIKAFYKAMYGYLEEKIVLKKK